MGFFMRGGLGLTAFFALSLWLYGCSTHGLDGTSVCGTEIEDPYQLAGCVEKDGGGLAIGVRVSAIPTNAGIAKSASGEAAGIVNAVAVAISDKNGIYKFKGLEKGEYTLYFEYQDTSNTPTSPNYQAHRLNGAYAPPKGVNSLGSSQLEPASPLILKALNAVDSATVEGAKCHIDNTPYAGTTGKSGLLILYPVAGSYFVLCEKDSLKSQPYLVNLELGQTNGYSIPMTEGGQAISSPSPSNVVAQYDTVNRFVRVSWSKPAAPGSFNYRVRRVETDKIDLLAGSENIAELFYYDPVFSMDGDTITSKTVQYKVAARRGAVYSNTVSSKPILVSRGPSVTMGFLDSTQKSCLAGDTALLLGAYKSALFHNVRLIWTARGGADTLKNVAVDNRSGVDTLAYPCILPGEPSIVLRVTDEAGITAIGNPFKFEIIPGP